MDDRVAPDKPLDSAVLSRLKKFSAMNKLKKMALRVRFFICLLFAYEIFATVGYVSISYLIFTRHTIPESCIQDYLSMSMKSTNHTIGNAMGDVLVLIQCIAFSSGLCILLLNY